MMWVDIKEEKPNYPSGYHVEFLVFGRRVGGTTKAQRQKDVWHVNGYEKTDGSWDFHQIGGGKDVKEVTHWMHVPNHPSLVNTKTINHEVDSTNCHHLKKPSPSQF